MFLELRGGGGVVEVSYSNFLSSTGQLLPFLLLLTKYFGFLEHVNNINFDLLIVNKHYIPLLRGGYWILKGGCKAPGTPQ